MFASATLLCVCLTVTAPAAYPPRGWGGGRAFHPNATPHWGCFGYCNGPLRPENHAMCFGYCPNHQQHWGCYGYCNGPFWTRSPYFWGAAVAPMAPYVQNDPSIIYQGNLNGAVSLPAPAPAAAITPDPALDALLATHFALKSGVDQWIEQLASPSAKRRGEAVEALGHYGPKAAKAVDALIPLLADKDANLRLEVTMTLAKIGAAALPGLTQALASDKPLIQMGACFSLGNMGKAAASAVPALRKALRASEAAVRCHAAQAMWRIDKTTKNDVLPVLSAGLAADNRAIRLGALTTLSQMGAVAEPAIPSVIQMLQDKDAQLRIAAAVALSNIAPSNTAALPALLAGLADSSEGVRRDAAAALAHMSLSGLDAGTALAPLVKGLRDDDAAVAQYSAIALSHLGAPAVAPLMEALGDKKTNVRRFAILALEQLGKSAAPAVSKLKQLATGDADPEIKFMADEAAQAIAAAK